MCCEVQLAYVFAEDFDQQSRTDLVFDMRSGFVRSVHARLQVSVYSGYDLFHPELTVVRLFP